MVLTRSGSKLQPNNMENNEEAVNSEPRVGAQNTQTQVPTNNPPTLQTNTGTGGIVRSSSAPSIGSDASISPDELNNTILSPAFSSLTAQNVRREFRQGNGDDRSEFNQANNLQEMMASIGLAQAQLMRSIEVIRQVQRDLQQARPTVRNSTEEGLSAEHAAGIQTPAIAPMTRAPPPLTRYPTVVENTQSMHGIREPPPSQAVRNEASGAENNNPIIAVDTRGQDYTGNPTEMRPQKPSNASSYHGNVAHQSSNRKYKVKDWGMRFNGSEKNVDALIDLSSSAFQNEDYKDLIDNVSKNADRLPDIKVIDGFVYKRTQFYDGSPTNEDFAWKLWIPLELTNGIIEKAHCLPVASHGGFHKTLKRIKEYFYWPLMNKQVRDFVLKCQVCKESKSANITLRPPMGKEANVERPFQRIFVDFLGPYPRSKAGNTYIFIVLDHLSKYVLLKAMNKASTKNVVKFLISEVFHKFGTPEVLISDNGQQFVAKEFEDLMTNFGISQIGRAHV